MVNTPVGNFQANTADWKSIHVTFLSCLGSVDTDIQ